MRHKVVLFGDSVLLAGVGKSLGRFPRLEVVSLDVAGEDAPREMDALCPAAVILDLSVVTTDFAFSLLSDRRDLLLIGLNPGGNGLLVLSGQQARQLTAADLVHLIDRSLPGAGEGAEEFAYQASGSAQNSQSMVSQEQVPGSDSGSE